VAALLATLLARAHVQPQVLARQHEPGWPVYENRQVI
jgi:hypothetical protein